MKVETLNHHQLLINKQKASNIYNFVNKKICKVTIMLYSRAKVYNGSNSNDDCRYEYKSSVSKLPSG